MPHTARWCYVCYLESPNGSACSECGGPLTDRRPPERRPSPSSDDTQVIVATLPGEEALVASGRLDAYGVPAQLRRVGEPGPDAPFHVMVATNQLEAARALLRRDGSGGVRRRRDRRPRRSRDDEAHTKALFTALLITAIALGLSGMMLAARWFLSGSPFPR